MSKLTRYNDDLFGGALGTSLKTFMQDVFDIDRNTVYRGLFSPPCDIVEADNEWVIHIDIPGMSEKDFTIKFESGTLIIQGERLVENKASNNKFTRLERQFGKFSRSWRLPENVDTDGTTAVYEKGILTVRLPKKEQEKPKTVEVKLLGK